MRRAQPLEEIHAGLEELVSSHESYYENSKAGPGSLWLPILSGKVSLSSQHDGTHHQVLLGGQIHKAANLGFCFPKLWSKENSYLTYSVTATENRLAGTSWPTQEAWSELCFGNLLQCRDNKDSKHLSHLICHPLKACQICVSQRPFKQLLLLHFLPLYLVPSHPGLQGLLSCCHFLPQWLQYRVSLVSLREHQSSIAWDCPIGNVISSCRKD